MDPVLEIRSADAHDTYALWLWANDPLTRAASHGRAPITWTDHVTWMNAQLASDDAVILIAQSGSAQPVGSTRFDTTDGWATARLSYVVAPEERGHGWSRRMLVMATDWLQERKTSVSIFADVMQDNEPSLRVFRALGWADVTGAGNGGRRFRRLFGSSGPQ